VRSIPFLAIYAVLGSLGLTLMKKGLNEHQAGFTLDLIKSPALVAGFALYGLSFILWLKILKGNDLSYAFPIASALLFVCISLFSVFLLHENMSFSKIIGMILITIGIIFISRG
jgi:multidrug transporter EmrE-like cation transporter